MKPIFIQLNSNALLSVGFPHTIPIKLWFSHKKMSNIIWCLKPKLGCQDHQNVRSTAGVESKFLWTSLFGHERQTWFLSVQVLKICFEVLPFIYFDSIRYFLFWTFQKVSLCLGKMTGDRREFENNFTITWTADFYITWHSSHQDYARMSMRKQCRRIWANTCVALIFPSIEHI